MSHHQKLTLKSPEGMSIARAVAFNKVTVNAFFEAYTDAVEKHHFTPDRIYNGLSMVVKPVKSCL